MTCMEVLEELVNPSARIPLTQDRRSWGVELYEPQSPSRVYISNVPAGTIVIRLDENFNVNRIFSEGNEARKRSDFLLIAEESRELIILHIEMKLNDGNRQLIRNQLLGSHCFCHYVREIGRSFWRHEGFLGNARHRYVYFTGTDATRKRAPSARALGALHDTPDTALAIDSPTHLNFKRLVGRSFPNV
jgi:hypothetical protein